MSRLLNRWVLGLGAGALAAWWVAREAMTPHYPDVSLHAGLELVSAPRRVLAISPHPLDLEWFCGGTCFLMKQAGSSVVTAVLSYGEAYGNHANMAQIREREQAQSAAVLGYDQVIHLGEPDGGMRANDLAPLLRGVWQDVRPDVVLAFDPEGPLPGPANNPDHVAAGAAVLDLARSGIAQGTRVYLYGTRHPNVTVDITEALPEKESAVRAHRSQLFGPDAAARLAVRSFSRLSRGRTPAYYAESFYRLV